MEVVIRPSNDLVTLVVVFRVEPENQDRLVQFLREGAEKLLSKQPGYIAASFHKSADGHRVINYAQWSSATDVEAYRSKPEIAEYFNRVRALAEFEPIICDVSYVHHA